MKRYNLSTYSYEENDKVDAFIKDIIKVYKKHGMVVTPDIFDSEIVIEELRDKELEKIKQASFWLNKEQSKWVDLAEKTEKLQDLRKKNET
jgi:hypothetical protein